MDKNDAIVSVRDLKLWFDTDFGPVQILNGISFDIYRHETLGIVGESGCGKSMTACSIIRLLDTPPARYEGEILFEGENVLIKKEREMRKLRGSKMSMIFQEPMTSLNPLFTISYQLCEPLMQHQGLSRREAREKALEELRRVRIADPEQRLDEYPYQLSGGMRQRVMIAMALACRPVLLIVDEPTTALDVTIQAQVLDLMRDLQKETGTAIAFITHDLGVIREMARRVVVLYCGEVMEAAKTEELFSHPGHPYTKGLLATLPRYGVQGKLETIPGMVPPSGQFPLGCVFAPRCAFAKERCRMEKPGVTDLGDGHLVRCFCYEEEG